MKLAQATWQEVAKLDRETVVLIPTGSLEQHGPHLPLFTDSYLVTAVAEAVEVALSDSVLLTPTLWLGASTHHLAFCGSLSASFEGYDLAISAVVDSLAKHGFRRFFIVNGHGGNASPNDVTGRKLKAKYLNSEFCVSNYWAGIDDVIAQTMEGPLKGMRHACEAETSLMLHLRPDLVRMTSARTDGLVAEDGPRGALRFFDEITETGNFGYPKLATATKGKRIFEAAVAGMVQEVARLGRAVPLLGLE